MRCLAVSCGLVAAVLAAASPSSADPVHYDVVDGLYANIPAGATGGPATQLGIDHWWYKYEPAWRPNQNGSPVVRDADTFLLMELGSDGSARHYGWAANHGLSINDRGVFRNGNLTSRFPRGGTTKGDGVWANAENSVQLALEWRAPSDGVAHVSFQFVGRDHANTDHEWHLATWTDGSLWTDLGFTKVDQSHSPSAPAVLAASNLDLDAGESIYLYGMIYDFDDWDGTVITGGIDFTADPLQVIPEPGSATLAILGLLGLGVWAAALRRRR